MMGRHALNTEPQAQVQAARTRRSGVRQETPSLNRRQTRLAREMEEAAEARKARRAEHREAENRARQEAERARIAEEDGLFTIDDVARGIADKLIHRHPHVFGDGEIPEDLRGVWERRKRQEKGRTSSLDGIARSMSSLARTQKVIARARTHEVPVELPGEPVTAEDVGERIQILVARAQASGVDADAAVREALRSLEERIRQAEGAAGTA